jgi:hypothetical protein
VKLYYFTGDFNRHSQSPDARIAPLPLWYNTMNRKERTIKPAGFTFGTPIPGLLALALLWAAGSAAQPPPDPAIFQAGVYADSARTVECVGGPPGTVFGQYVWAWSPAGAGATYLTIRFRFPVNVGFAGRPVLNGLVTNLIISDYGSGGVEWNFILSGCPTGWILLFHQDCTILAGDASEIVISGEFSLARNCDFELEVISVLNNLRVETEACTPTPVTHSSWGAIKDMYE